MALVIDTDVLVAAIRSRTGASNKILQMILRGELKVVASVTLMLEYEAVLTRPTHLNAANMTAEDIGVLLDTLAMCIQPVNISYLWRPTLPDIQDEMVLEAAVNGTASAITTFNKKHFSGVSSMFSIDVLNPSEVLERKFL